MKKRYNLFNFVFKGAIAMIVASSLFSCNKERKELPTIAQIVVNLKGFSQMEAAIIKGKLAVVLSNKNLAVSSDGNYTVFAPTNQAFAKLGLLRPQDLNSIQDSFLLKLLGYHINNGKKVENDFTNGTSLTSLSGTSKRIIQRGSDFYINGSKIISTNVAADNGVVHAIDKVLLASGTDIEKTAVLFAQGKGFVQPELSFLVEAVIYCDLANTLTNQNANYTVFAPTNQAFKDLGKSLNILIENPSDVRKLSKTTLTQILLTHIIDNGGKFTSELYAGNISTLSAKQITLGIYTNGVLTIKGSGNSEPANMLIPDVQATNGVIHIIDRVILP